MKLCRVVYKPDGTVAVIHAALDARDVEGGETLEAFYTRAFGAAMAGTELEGLPYDDIDPATLPSRTEREMWRGAKGAGVWIDTTVKTTAERRAALEAQIDAELAQASPDPVRLLKLKRKLEKGEF